MISAVGSYGLKLLGEAVPLPESTEVARVMPDSCDDPLPMLLPYEDVDGSRQHPPGRPQEPFVGAPHSLLSEGSRRELSEISSMLMRGELFSSTRSPFRSSTTKVFAASRIGLYPVWRI